MRLTGAKGFVIGVGVLAGMQLVLSSSRGTNAFGIATNLPTRWLQKWFDPTQPLISDHRKTSATAGGGSGGKPDCSGMVGLAKTMCQSGYSTGSTQLGPTPTQIPTTSATAAQLSV
jgi:hypothetical protein